MATCSLMAGARSSRASAPSRRARSRSMPSALPSESFTPCGTTGLSSASAHASRQADGLGEAGLGHDLQEIDAVGIAASTSAASSGRQDTPTPFGARVGDIG